jgi:hypothetical protein
VLGKAQPAAPARGASLAPRAAGLREPPRGTAPRPAAGKPAAAPKKK